MYGCDSLEERHLNATQDCALVPLTECPTEKCRPKTSLCREIGSRSDVSRSLGQTRVYAKRAPAEQAAGNRSWRTRVLP